MPRIHANWIDAYMDYSSHSEAPDTFHFWTAVSTIAGALRRRVWIRQGYFDWVPNCYIVFVAPPGIVSKSTTASIGMNLLRQVPGINFGPDAMTWQALITSLAASAEQFIIGEEYHTMSAITVSSSEFGTLLNPSDREMVDALVSLWDGQVGTFEKKTKTMGDDKITNPWINLLACTTPAWIGGNFPEYMIGGGFMSRCVFVYAEHKRHLIAYPGDHVPANFAERQANLVHDLEAIAQLAGAFTLSPAAKKWGEDWYQKHYENPGDDLDRERLGGYIARKQTHLHKLAMIISASKRDNLIIEREDLLFALEQLNEVEKHMNRIFSYINAPEARAAHRLLEIIEAKGSIPKADLYSEVFHSFSYNDYLNAVNGLIASGKVIQYQHGSTHVIKAASGQKNPPTAPPTVEG